MAKILAETNHLPAAKKKKLDFDNLELWMLCALPIILIFVFSYLPMGGIIIAFKDYTYDLGIFGSQWVGFKNFEFFLRSTEFLKLIRNTLFLNAIFIATSTIGSIAVAIALYYVGKRSLVKIFQTIMITPNFISWVVAAYMCYAFLNPNYGFINVILGHFGIEGVDWYGTPKAWILILTIANLWKGVGMSSIYYYAALMGIDEALLDAAVIDGANERQKICHIILPSLLPLVVIFTIMAIGGIFNSDFGMFYQLTRDVGVLYDVTDVIDTYVFRAMRLSGEMSMGTAVGLLKSIVGLALIILTNHLSKKIDPDFGLL